MADRDLLLDETSGVPELVVDAATNQLALAEGVRLVEQYIAQTFDTQQGEWAWDTSFGIPYLGEFLVKAPDVSLLTARVRAKARNVPDVRKVFPFELEIEGRQLTGRLSVDTVYGPVTQDLGL